ncbi:MAG TPA: hypothetical protein VLJ76_01180 [Gaiellaceae bacterium]|nr:hypothetical protein [Gaiellaceae bacterium]
MSIRSLAVAVALAVGVAIGAALFGVATAVEAAIPDSTGVIHGCYKKSGGKLRVVDQTAGQSCASDETPLSWSQTGPQGAAGPQGPRGFPGVRGPAEPAGRGPVFVHYVNLAFQIAPGKASVIGSVHLPVGTYTLDGTVIIGGGNDGEARCRFVSNASVESTHASEYSPEILQVHGDVVVRAPNTDVDLRCTGDADRSDTLVVDPSGSYLEATQVASVTQSN